ncbi:hypothetical protein LOK49_LG15G02595 [Camellia lanceoleosa]|uniref:Uncharacterized protein n=1 Tax=Camellia lanceoleosa TaxID=1840588 RepID=A0ACC0F5X7_9ERIC|nr:hypothetical protein LOK49_LG15G02595 [Camellia lanceoleosa]
MGIFLIKKNGRCGLMRFIGHSLVALCLNQTPYVLFKTWRTIYCYVTITTGMYDLFLNNRVTCRVIYLSSDQLFGDMRTLNASPAAHQQDIWKITNSGEDPFLKLYCSICIAIYGFLCILFYSIDILLILLNIIDLLSKGTGLVEMHLLV